MALHPDFPESPHAILDPAIRWFPADEALRTSSFEKLLPPLVPELRKQVHHWRDKSYAKAGETSRSLLNWWFKTSHLLPQADGTMAEFQYYFAQREAMETIIYLYDVVGVKDKYDLMRFDRSGAVSTGMFDETWRRLVVKMATGAGKTKVLGLVLAWSYFHKLYEPDSELERLRKQANDIDNLDSPYKAIISVLVLKEGWDVRNVTTIVGLRAYSAKSNILPEQTLGRGLRKIYPGGVEEYVSVVGTNAFMDFVESLQAEGVVLERKPMGEGTKPKTPLVVEIDTEDTKKNLDALDIAVPVLTPRVYRDYKNLSDLNVGAFGHGKVPYRQFSAAEQREIVFKDITTGEMTHTTILDTAGVADYRSVIGYFTQTVMKDLRLVSGYDVLYGKVKEFVQSQLFTRQVDLDDPNTLRNLSELAATKTLIETCKKAINALTIQNKGDAQIRDTIKLRHTRPFVAKDQGYLIPKKSVFNRIIGDSHFELLFAQFLDGCMVRRHQ